MSAAHPARLELVNPFARTLAALRRWPDSRQWLRAAPVLAATAAIAFVLPAFAEEIVFRGLLMPVPGIASMRLGMWLSIVLFVLWHPLQAWIFGPPWAGLFLAPAFLAAVLVLAIGLTHVRIVTGSLWPAILGHWLLIVVWKLLFGGPFY